MGIFDRFKQTRTQGHDPLAEREFKKRVLTMDTGALGQLTNDELLNALLLRMQARVNDMSEEEALEILNEAQRTLYVLKVFDEEIHGGGLLQFFVNDSRILAPLVSEALKKAEASPFTEIFDDFIQRQGIDLTDLTSFQIDDIREYELNIGRYPFDDFDSAYYYENLKNPMERFMVVYARKHLGRM